MTGKAIQINLLKAELYRNNLALGKSIVKAPGLVGKLCAILQGGAVGLFMEFGKCGLSLFGVGFHVGGNICDVIEEFIHFGQGLNTLVCNLN